MTTALPKIDWGQMLHELRYKFAPYESAALKDAVLNFHPRDFRRLLSEVDYNRATWVQPVFTPNDPWRVMGLLVNETDLIPEGVLVLCSCRGEIIATVNVDDGVIRR